MYRQNLLLRRHALGNFRDLLHAIARDPAMVVYLDTRTNRRGAPNENFARELLELFTLGEGHYRESDIRELARAFTGWGLDARGRFRFDSEQHDYGDKRIFGARANYGGAEAIELILRQPRTARFIVARLWREFVSPQPRAPDVERLATAFARDWELVPLIAELLVLAREETPGNLFKSPVELVVGSLRWLELEAGPAASVACVAMGQALFNPPNVRGWPGGESWITADTLFTRRDYLRFMTGAERETPLAGPDMTAEAADARRPHAQLAAYFDQFAEDRIRAHEPAPLCRPPLRPAAAGASPADQVRSWLLDPVYQVK